MKLDQIKNELFAIGKTYPTVLGILRKRIENTDTTVGSHWAKILAESEPKLSDCHLENVCYEMATLEISLPDPIDRLPFDIREEVLRRMRDDQERLLRHARDVLSQEGDHDAEFEPSQIVIRKWNERRRAIQSA